MKTIWLIQELQSNFDDITNIYEGSEAENSSWEETPHDWCESFLALYRNDSYIPLDTHRSRPFHKYICVQ